MSKTKEPSCILNHDVMRRELRDKGMPTTDCPDCGWTLNPAKPEPETYEATLEFRVGELEDKVAEIIRKLGL
jgi:hypothetical protein